MLAVRQHLSECAECRFEFESLLRIKRAFGTMQPRNPAPDLAVRIYAQLDQLSQTPQEHLFESVRKRFTFFPNGLRFAAASISLFAVLLTLRSGQTLRDSYTFIPLPQDTQVSAMAEQAPVRLFGASSPVAASASYKPEQLPEAPAQTWELSGNGSHPRSTTSGSGMMLASFSPAQ